MTTRELFAATVIAGATLIAGGFWGCAGGRKINCDMVQMHRQTGMSDTEIGAGFAVSAAEVTSSCGPAGAAVGAVTPAATEASAPSGAAPDQPAAAPSETSGGGGSPY